MRLKSPLILLIIALLPVGAWSAEGDSYSPENRALSLKGDVVQLSEYSGPGLGSLSLKRIFVFGKDKRPVSEKTYDDEGVLKNETTFVYTADGLISEILGEGPDGSPSWKYAYTYDEERRLLEEASYDGQGLLEWRDVYRYSEEGLLVEKSNYNSSGSVNLQNTYQYDDKRRLSLRLTLYSDGKLLKRVAVSYNDKDQAVTEERYDANGLYEQVEFMYDDEGRSAGSRTLAPDGSTKETCQRLYDAKGNLIREKIATPGKTPDAVTSYIYDAQGNWVRKRESSGVYILREISYGP